MILIEDFIKAKQELYTNNLLNFLFSKRFTQVQYFDLKQEKINLTIPESFSLLQNPNKSMEFIIKVYNLRYSNRSTVILDFSKCINLDMGALSVLNIIILNLKNEFAKMEKKVNFKMKFSKDMKINTIIYKAGIIKLLKIEKFPDSLNECIEKIKLYNKVSKFRNLQLLVSGKTPIEFLNDLVVKGTASLIIDHIKFGAEVTAFINNCLESIGFKLTLKGEKIFKELIGEISTNSFEHLGNEMSQLFCTGYYQAKDSESGEGSIVFFNFGKTIYESLKEDSEEDVKNKLKALSEKHVFNEYFTEDTLWTLASLQPKISSKSSYNSGEERGTGSIKLIESFRKISGSTSSSLMSIISGKNQILFDNSKISMYNEEIGRIAFNEENSLEKMPNRKYVKNLNYNFPGTIIIIDFTLEKEFLKENK